MNYIKELLFPRRCPVCDKIVKQRGEDWRAGKIVSGFENNICDCCVDKLVPVSEPWCCKCGKPLKKEEQEYCRDCSHKNHNFTRGRAVFTYDSAAASLYRFKYAGRQEYADYYGKMAAFHLAEEYAFRQAQALIPVPLHPCRERKRGYNQALLFAEALGKAWDIPVYENLVIRCKNTKPLKQLNPVQRQNNLKKAFKIVQNDVKLNTIIIVDDIYTTGNTIDAVADVLTEAGVNRIYFVTIAVGNGF